MRCLNCQRDGLSTSAELCPHCGVHLPSLLRDLLPPGTLLHGGKYRLDYPLGRGGFGITYRAIHLALEQFVAIKEFFPHEHAVRDISARGLSVPSSKQEPYERSLQRFMREGRVLAQLRHDNVVRVSDLFEERSTGYLVMELVLGKSLREELDAQPQRRLGTERAAHIVGQLVDALAAVHEQGIYHLDIKPENVLMGADGRPVLIDFGAAHQGLGTRSTQAFTLEYAAPEVLAGEKVGAESDLFELGMVAYEMVMGERAPSTLSRLTGNEEWEPRDLPGPWQELLASALRLRRQERPQSVKEWWSGGAAGSGTSGQAYTATQGQVPDQTPVAGHLADSLPLETQVSTLKRSIPLYLYILAELIGVAVWSLINYVLSRTNIEHTSAVSNFKFNGYLLKVSVTYVLAFGLAGVLFGFKWPSLKWKWGMLLASIPVLNYLWDFMNLRFGLSFVDPSISNSWMIERFVYLTAIPLSACLGSLLGAVFSRRNR